MASSNFDEHTEAFVARMPVLQRLLGVRLATLRQIVQRSASLAFGRETGLSDFDWLVVWFIGSHPNPVAADVSENLQRDKGQVSRAVTRLTAAGLISREHLRAPLVLTPQGQEVFARIERLVRTRNEAMLEGVTADDRALLDGALDKLFRSAMTLLLQERSDDRDDAIPTTSRDVWRPSRMQRAEPTADLIVPDLYMLLRLLRRSADLAFSRVTGLSNFDWRALARIEIEGPLTLSDLITGLDRNKSQVGRAVERLVALDLVSRKKEPGVSSVVLSTAPQGKAAYDRIFQEAQRRHNVLVDELTMRENRGLQTILDQLLQNAIGLLERERALEAKSGRPGGARAYASDDA
jgi:DNA-binding MarR family transcriptional regulator